jgi:hypothetical protein
LFGRVDRYRFVVLDLPYAWPTTRITWHQHFVKLDMEGSNRTISTRWKWGSKYYLNSDKMDDGSWRPTVDNYGVGKCFKFVVWQCGGICQAHVNSHLRLSTNLAVASCFWQAACQFLCFMFEWYYLWKIITIPTLGRTRVSRGNK